MKTIHHQKGFSAVEIVLVVVVVGLLGSGGWYVWTKNKDTDGQKQKSTVSQQTNNNNNDNTNSDDTSDSVKLTTKLVSHNNVFSILLPDGWKFTNDTELDYAHAIGLDDMKYAAGTPAVVVDEMGHRGGGITTASFVIQSGSNTDLENYFNASQEKGSFTTDAGVECKKYLFTASEGDETLVAGSKSHGYKIVQGNKIVVMTYIMLPTDLDQLETVEAAIKTFKFL